MNKQGYVFLSADQVYVPGDIYQHNKDTPRWYCVDEYVHKINVKWPGKLYRVEVLDFISNDEPPKLVKNPGYIRALSFKIIEALPSANLFGDQGEKICSILNWIQSADVSDFEKIGSFITEAMPKIYSDAWDKWLKTIDPESSHLGDTHYGVIGIPTKRHNPDSPVGKGLYLISDFVARRAEFLVGEARWITYVPQPDDDFEEDDNPQCLAPLWANARDALFFAAMGYGAKDFLTENEASILLRPWSSR